MAVCGRCLLCGHKFSGEGEDEAVRWTCHRCPPPPPSSLSPGAHEHAICTGCHDRIEGGEIAGAVGDLLALLTARAGAG